MPEAVDVLIVGAGFAGIGMGIQLARRGRESFVILEQADDVGGTWRDNRYPGVACDIPSHLYSFSFRPNPHWSRVFAEGAEIQDYLRECVRGEGIGSNIRLDAAMTSAQWDASSGRWSVRSTRGDFSAGTLIVATGRLSEPKLPGIEGLASFPGPHWHSARWNAKISLIGKRVGVVGTGASAVQILPRLAGEASEVVIFQRSAPYVLPRGDRQYTTAERERFAARPETIAGLREQQFADAERNIEQRRMRRPDIDILRQRALDHLASHIDDPGLRAALTPDYEIGCKRILFSDDYYPALRREHVRVESTPLAGIVDGRAVAESGRGYALDVLILATGFNATRPAIAQRISGRDGRLLAEQWRGGMAAHASTTVHGFPNMYVLDGPNSALGHNSAIFVIETQIGYVLGALEYLRSSGSAALEVTDESVRAYMRDIDERARGTVWTQGGCTSWYRDEQTGRVTLLWPDTATSFRERNGSFDPLAYRELHPPRPAVC